MKKLLFAALLSAALSVHGAASADPLLQYNNVDLAYQYTDGDIGGNFDGLHLEGTYVVYQNLFLDLGYDFDSSNHVDVNTLKYGGGIFHPISKDLHIVGNIGGTHASVDIDGAGSFDIDRFYIGPELRYRVLPNVEVDGGYTWTDGDGESENDFNIDGLYGVNANWAVKLGINFLEDAEQYSAGVRYAF